MKLNKLKINDTAIITNLLVNNNIKKRLLDIGMSKGSKIKKVLENKNMITYNIKGANIAIRKTDTKNVEVTK
ncbi:MAG: ferrous iron transport protein A [Bacilli bacterium]|nr:ferrous iron transport protein A [Bacilli bacterium]